jgi:hypothetical protein
MGKSTRLLVGRLPRTSAAGWSQAGRWLLAAGLALASLGQAQAQLSVPFSNPVTTTAGPSVNLPLNAGYAYVRQANIYAASEINAPAGTLTRLSLFTQSAATPGATPTKVYIKHVTGATFTAASTVAAEETGATLVYDATIPAANFATGAYVPIVLGTGAGTSTFAYDGTSNLEIIIETNAGTPTEGTSAKTFRTSVTPAGNTSEYWLSNTTPSAGNGTLSASFRPNVLLGGLGYATDAGVQTIYALNRLGITGVSPHVVRAAVLNNSFTAQTNVPVTLTVTGPSGFTFTNTQTIASLPVGTTATVVAFAGYTPTVVGSYTLTVSTADASNVTNNTQTLTQTVTDAPGISSYINGNPLTARGFGVAGSGNGFAVKIPTSGAVTVTAMRAKLGVTGGGATGKTVYGVVIDPANGAILARSNDYVVLAADEATAGAPVTFTMQTPVIVGAGNLMVGLVQTYQTGQTTNYFPFAVGLENPLRTGVYYSFNAITPSAPVDLNTGTAAILAAPSYRLLMEAVTTAAPACVPATSLAAGSITTTGATLTFTGDAGSTSYSVNYIPTAGGASLAVSPTPTGSPVVLSSLSPGTQYVATVVSNCGGGTTGTAANVTFTTLPTVDASTTVLYSLYKLPIPFGGPHAVQAVVTNNGTSALTNLPVNLSVTGAGGFTFTNTQTVPSLAVGASATVTFAGYTPSTAGTGTVTVTTNLSGDQIAGNNAKTMTQVATTTDYAYTDASAPPSARGFGPSTNVNAFAAKFTLSAPRNVTGVRAYLVDFVAGAGSTIGKTVYGVLLNPTTGAVLATSAPLVVTAANINTYTAFTFTTPVTLASGDFLVGLAQTYQTGQTTQYFPIGTPPEVPGRSGAFFTASITSPAAPVESGGANNIKFMLEAITDVVPACVAPSNLTFTNPTATSVTVNFTAPFTAPSVGYSVTYTPTGSGSQPVTTTTTSASISGLTAGVTYTFSVTSDCGGTTSTAATGSFTTIPANDQCAGAVAIACGSSTAGTTRGSTSTNDPSGAHSGGTIFPAAGGVWYSFAGTGDRVTASLCSTTNTAFDSQLFVFSGSCGSLTDVAADDDGCGVGGLSTVTFFTTAGTTYYVYVTGFVNSGTPSFSDFTLTTTCVSPDLVVSAAQAISGIYRNVTITSTGAATLSGDLTASGTITVQSGGTLTNSTAFYVQGTANFVLQAGGTIIEPNSAGIVNNGSGGFDLSGTLTLSPDANFVFNAGSAQVTGALMPARVRNLTVNNSAAVASRRLTLTNGLSVAQVVRLSSGNLVLNGKSLLLLSDAAGTALVDNTGGTVTGATASMQRAITNTTVSGPAYRHFSSPVSSIVVDSLGTGGSSPVVNGAYNSAAAPNMVTPFPTVFGYDEGRIATTVSTYNDFDKGWFSPASTSTALLPTKGYTVNAPVTAVPVRFTGTFNNGAQNSGALARGSNAQAGWHLLGNPYPAPLDWSTVGTGQRPGMDAAMYVYQSSSQYGGTYRSYVNGVGGASPLIDAGSGYFVRVAAAGTPGAVNLTNANRISSFGAQPAFGRGTTDARPLLELQVTGAGLSDAAYLYMENGATAGIDTNYDAVKLPNTTGLNLASLVGNQALSINGLPALAGARETVIPLTLAAPMAGRFSFEVARLANFGSTTVYLRDALTGTQQLLVAGDTYAFTLATALSGQARFALVFRPAGALATAPAFEAGQVSVYPNPAHGKFTVLLPPVAGQRVVQAALLNVLGQVVTTRVIALTAAGATAEFDTQALAKGVYVLRLTAGPSTLTQRVTVE